mgnify:FL=1
MNLAQVLTYSQIVLSVFLVAGILLQQKGSGLGSAMGGSGIEYSTKRGAEKFIFGATIVFAVLFIAVSVARIYFS